MDRIVLDPDSSALTYFNFMIRILAVLSIVLSSLYACFSAGYFDIRFIDYVFEFFFLIDMVLQFFTQIRDPEDPQRPIRQLKAIAVRYLMGNFYLDLLAISSTPLILIFSPESNEDSTEVVDLLYLLRYFRMYKIFTLLNEQEFHTVIKKCFRRRLNLAIAQSASEQGDNLHDNNKIMTQIYVMYMFRILKLVIFILALSYILGSLWFLITKHTTNYLLTEENGYTGDETTFYKAYKMKDMTPPQQLIVVVYFTFTTLSTVGFGDYHPKSEIERIVTTVILLVGVACFSYIMGQFIDILMNLQTVTADNEDSENLSKWLGLLAHFNKNSPLPKEMTKRFEKYFEYYWANDKNYAIQSKEDQRFMTELPNHIQTDIHRHFLFADFLYMFRVHFKFQKEEIGSGRPDFDNEYDWQDTQYSQFMINLLQQLEPRFYSAQEYIFEEDDEVNEQIYVISQPSLKQKDKTGKYCIGFSDQKQRYFHVKLGHKTIIGGYENLFGYKSEFFYKALHHIDAYGLRKDKLKPIMDKYPEFKKQIRAYMVNFYYRIIKRPMLEFKRNILSQVRKRQDMDKIIKDIDGKIKQAEQRFKQEMEEPSDNNSGNNDETHRNVQKLENKVNHLAKSVHDLFVQFDDLTSKMEMQGSPSKAGNRGSALHKR